MTNMISLGESGGRKWFAYMVDGNSLVVALERLNITSARAEYAVELFYVSFEDIKRMIHDRHPAC